ncbi:MAG: hypothetical protein WEA56_10790 [Balneolaceae bacterium]
MSDLKEKREIAQSEARDKTTKIIAGMVPMGSAAYELLTTIVVPLHEKKRREFIHDLASRLKKLEDQGQIDFEELGRNEEFNTITTKAILLAQQNHQKEKIQALKNLVENTALKMSTQKINSDIIEHYLNQIERFSDLHFLLLKTFESPIEIMKGIGRKTSFEFINLRMVFSKLHPELDSKKDYIQIIWKDLYNEGLVIKETMQHSVPVDGAIKSIVTDFGEGLLDYIRIENNP